MMGAEQWDSPVLHRHIYLEGAVHEALAWYQATHQVVCAVTAVPEGWRLTLTDPGTWRGTGEMLLRDLMNAVLTRSLEVRLAGMTP